MDEPEAFLEAWDIEYEGLSPVEIETLRTLTDKQVSIKVNGTILKLSHGNSTDYTPITTSLPINLKRGDYIQCYGGWYPSCAYSKFQIRKI